MKTDMAWMEDAACAHHYRFTELDEAQQLPLCQGCTVGDRCLDWGLAHKPVSEVHTVTYGGRTANEQAVMLGHPDRDAQRRETYARNRRDEQIHTQLTAIIAAALHPQTKETK